MFFKKKLTAAEKGERLGQPLVRCASVAVQNLATRLPGITSGGDKRVVHELLVEVFAFYVHVANRLAFRDLGPNGLTEFGKGLALSAKAEIRTVQDGDSLVDHLSSIHAERERYYAKFARILPEGEQSPKNTLFYEFEKFIFTRFVGTGDVADLIVVQDVFSIDIPPFLKEINQVLKM